MGHDEQLALPTEQPLLIIVGATICFWGVSLLCAAVPSLVCTPVMPRALRLGSMGVRVAAACVGMMYGPNVPIVAIVFSGGAILAYCLELLLSAWLSRLPTEDTYSKIALDDGPDSGVELTNQSDKDGDGALNRDGEPPSSAPVVSPLARGLAAAVTALYFAVVRGLQLGADIHVLGGHQLEIDIVCTLGQIALFACALSVALQDTRGLDLPASAAVMMSFACAAPLGILIGGLTTNYDGTHINNGASTKFPEKGLVGFGYSLGYVSCFMGGALLYQTFASTLPREVSDANAEWTHKFSNAASRNSKNRVSDSTFLRMQMSRIFALISGWFFMCLFHWPELSRGFLEE